jgi:methylenetetrahydrofolate reductase (NADPH)
VLAAKVDAGADEAITQMFFDNTALLRLRDRIEARAIDVMLTPGIFPIHSLAAVARFASRCGATIPTAVAGRFEAVADDADATHRLAARFAAEQIDGLRSHGIDQFHLYTLNRSALALDVCNRVGALPTTATP